jgi:hypothetical protein
LDDAEALALFRAQVIGPLLCRQPQSHGELSSMLRELPQQPMRAPGSEVSRCYAASTIERWYYAFKKHQLAGLRSRSRGQGHALRLGAEQRELLMSIRRDHPRVSAALIVRTLVARWNRWLPLSSELAAWSHRRTERSGAPARCFASCEREAARFDVRRS